MGKVFHCVADSKGETLVMYIDNSQACFANQQWAYAATAIGVAIPFFILFPVWLIRKTKLELLFSNSAGMSYSTVLTFRQVTYQLHMCIDGLCY